MNRKLKKRYIGTLCNVLVFMTILAGCGEGDYNPIRKSDNGILFDATKPVIVSDFLPKSGGVGSRVVVYGNNFGNDLNRVKVTIGGQPAVLISTKGESLLCMVPAKAYSGEIKVIVTDEEGTELKSGVCKEHFAYQRKMLVSTLCGKMYENNTKYDIKTGPFEDCGGFPLTRWFAFDPKNPDMLYCAAEKQSFRVFDFQRRYVDIFTTNIDNVSSVTFTLNGDMVVSRDQGSDTNIGLYMFTKESGFKTRLELCNGRGVKTVATHPVNGRIYYTLYRKGQVWSVDPYNPADNKMEVGLPRTGTGVNMVWHPTGEYCYLIHYERHTIWRADYDKVTGKLLMPYLICGKDNTSNWNDGVGTSVRMKKPWQGFFLKNNQYDGQEDEYDFYFTDNGNHCIRILNPMGRVSTYAGRADGGTNGYREGELRTEAQFYYPEGLVYDQKRACIYVGDANNRVVRKIAPEE